MRVYLSGFMGSGKTTVGPRVAARLGQPFLDLDRLIQVHAGRSIPQIFEADGEGHFRDLEWKALRRTNETEDLVVALGGGAVVDEANRRFAKENGLLVYLQVDAETVLERVGDEGHHRPLLEDRQGEPLPKPAMADRIQNLLDERAPAYADSHVTVDARQPVAAVVQAVVDAVHAAEAGSPTPGTE